MTRTNLAFGLAVTLMAGLLSNTALAQIGQRNAAGKIMGDALFDQPGQPAAQKLAPVDDPPIATPAAKLPIAQLHVPEGFKLEVYASGIANARSMALGDKGTVFVGNRTLDKVYAVVPSPTGNIVKVIASGLNMPNGVAFKDGNLYVAEVNKIWRFDDIETSLDNPPKPTLIYSDLPSEQAHGWKFIGIGPDNKLYIPIGAPGNILMPPPQYAQIRRISLDGKTVEMVATGVRNSVGFDWNPVTKDFFFSNNGRDWVSEDLPNDTVHIVKASATTPVNFGYPYCHQGDFTDPEYGWGRSCDEFAKPAALMGPHAGVLGLRFYTGDMFPASYKGDVFLARHGSWDRTVKIGGDVVAMKLRADGSVEGFTPFLTGFLQNNNYIGRPVDVLQLKDGSVLVSDDWNGAIWRVTYAK